MIRAAILFLLSYTAGSINFAILLFRILRKGDPRDQHSGNAGTTNVYRQAGILWAAVVLLLDVGRAVLVAFLAATILDPGFVPWTCLFLVLGNRYPLFHGFRGGKGVANYLGFTFFIAPWAGVISCAVWVAAYAVVRTPFIASFFMIAVLSAGTVFRYFESPWAVAGAVATAALVCFNHRINIAQYRAGKGGSEE
ncbi:MAG: glycerol-3-phosphate acyltransferase [Spirochaetes bacterium]|nr:glycerol-3-phosphate acyltransferase [Spirochaetota bacterium]